MLEKGYQDGAVKNPCRIFRFTKGFPWRNNTAFLLLAVSVYTYPITVTFEHQLRFTRGAFELENETLSHLLKSGKGSRVLLFLEEEVAAAHPGLQEKAAAYLAHHCPEMESRGIVLVPGGETAKNDVELRTRSLDALREAGLDRHSYVLAVGGGAFLDLIGFVSTITHRGIRLVRFPTTTLSQDDSGVGVKNGVNAYGQKNFWGTFSVPYAVVNDFDFLETLPEEERRAGMVEAVKVSLVKDSSFFEWIEAHADELKSGNREVMWTLIERSAVLHAEHIALSGDPFEMGSSRPLDFGHWAAHKLELLSGFSLGHGQAVSIGIAVDVLYSTLSGFMEPEEAMRVLNVLECLGLPLWSSCLDMRNEEGRRCVLEGLKDFQEHLGGELTVLMLNSPGVSFDVNEVDAAIVEEAIDFLQGRHEEDE